MTRYKILSLAFGSVVLVGLLGCSGGAESPASAPAAPPGTESGARTLPIPGQQLPADHPPVESPVGSGPLRWTAPDGWIEEPPASRMRIAQYRVPGETGSGECIVYYFGPGQGGDAMANAQRWAGQFTQPDGTASLDRLEISELATGSVPIQLVEVTGTYDGGMTMTDAPAEQKTGYMLLGGIAQGSDAPWFFKFTGPESLVREQRPAFVKMMESLRTDG